MEEEIDLMDMFKYFWKRKVWIIVVGIICVVLAAIYIKFLLTPKYTSTSKFILTSYSYETEADVIAYASLPNRYYEITSSKNVLDKVIKNLKLDMDALELNRCLEIINNPNNYSIEINVTTDNAQLSAKIANEMVKVTIEEIVRIYDDNKIQILDYAVENSEPVNVDFIKITTIFVLVGEVLLCGYILILYIFIEGLKNNKLKDLEEKESIRKRYLVEEKEILSNIKKSQKYTEYIKEKKGLEDALKNEDYKKISKINEEILRYYVEEAYVVGFITANKVNRELIEK